jgi:hypothetical protein
MELKDWEKLRVRKNKVLNYFVTLKIYRLADWGNLKKQQWYIFFPDKTVEMIDWAYFKILKALSKNIILRYLNGFSCITKFVYEYIS